MTLAPPPALTRDPFAIGWRPVTTKQPDGTLHTVEVPLTEEDFLYPQEEDRFMLTQHHIRATMYLTLAIESANRNRPAIKVFAEHRIDWQKEDLRPNGPDISVFDNYPHPIDMFRGTLPVADEGVQPLLVIEVTSPSTRHIDVGRKLQVYHDAGVPNYLILDMREDDSDIPDPVFIGHQDTPDEYEVLEHGELGVWIDSVGMWFAVEHGAIVTYDANRNRILEYAELETLAELEKNRADTAEQRAEAEKDRADAAEQREWTAIRKAQAATQQAQAATQQAQAEKQRADELASELAALKSRLSG